jgi:WD40 repeat protein
VLESEVREMLEEKLKVFVSYARKDLAFAEQLVAALEARGLSPTIDTRDLPKLEDWRRELLGFIREADAVVFVVSPNSIASPVCAWEIEQVGKLSKRLAPIVLERVADDKLPSAVSKINYIYFDAPGSFDDQVIVLARALLTNSHWLKEHTRIGELAHRWHERQRTSSLLLRGQELDEAGRWIAAHPRSAPEPTDLQRQFIEEGRHASRLRQRRTIIGAFVVAALGLGLAAFSYWQSTIAQKNEASAKAERDRALLTQSRFLADLARQQTRDGFHGLAILLSIAGLPDQKAGIDRPVSSEAQRALHLALSQENGGQFHQLEDPVAKELLAQYRRALADKPGFPNSTADGQHHVFLPEDQGRENRVAWLRNAKGDNLAKLVADGEDMLSAAFSRDGRLLLTVSGKPFLAGARLDNRHSVIRVWEVPSGRLMNTIRSEQEHQTVEAFFLPTNDGIVTVSARGTLRIWRLSSGVKVVRLEGVKGRIWSATFSPDGKRALVLAYDSRSPSQSPKEVVATVWTVADGRRGGLAIRQGADLATPVFGPDSRFLATADARGVLSIWDTANGKLVASFEQQSSRITGVDWSPNGSRIVAALSDSTVAIFDVPAKTKLLDLPKYPGEHASARFDRQGERIVTSGRKGGAQIWNASNGAKIVDLERPMYEGNIEDILRAGFSPDGTRLWGHATLTIAGVWDSRSGKLMRLQEPKNIIYSTDFHPTGRKLLTTNKHSGINILDTKTGETVNVDASQEWHRRSPGKGMYSPDGRAILLTFSESHDHSVRIFDSETREEIAVLEGHEGAIYDAVFTPDSERVLTISDDGTLRVWPVFSAVQRLVDHAKRVVPRCLTASEAKAFFLDPEPPTWCVTGPGKETEPDTASWNAKWPFWGAEWKSWLSSGRKGGSPHLPDDASRLN